MAAVAPFTGAWIEILSICTAWDFRHVVAPFTGAWIEIAGPAQMSGPDGSSHPSRVRGLKSISAGYRDGSVPGSHPSRVRGLKYILPALERYQVKGSHPSRVRGLKSTIAGA